MPRQNSIEVVTVAGKPVYRFTTLGLTELRQLALVGTPQRELADYFGVTADWMRRQLLTEQAVIEAYKGAEADGRLELRGALHDAAKGGDARVLTFLGERRLGMTKVVEHKHEHRVAVIGTMPSEKLESGDWFEQFAPKDVAAQIQRMDTPQLESAEGVQDAEVVECD